MFFFLNWSEFQENQKLIANLTDVGLYSYSALCCVALSQLFDDEENKEFSISTMEAINKHICLPSQAASSIMEMLRSACCDEGRPFADSLLAEKCLKNNGLPVITDLLTMAVFHGHYDARMRVVIKFVSWQLRVSWDQVEEVEALIAETLEGKQYEMSEEELKEKKRKSRNTKLKRFALIGLATVGGGALVGLTGGLAAPLVAAGAASIIGGAGAAALGTTAGVAIIGSLFGVAGAGLTGYKMKKRVGAIEEFEFETLLMYGKQLHITIAISGWLSDHVTDFKIPWQHLAESREQYTLRWESKYLKQLGTAMDYIFNTAMSMATQEALKYTILSGLISAIAWPGALLSVAGVIDNPWSVCIQRASAAGKQLAEVLLAREQGNRPVTLVGYSLGSRVIFSCLEELARRKGSQGIIEDVVVLGSPVTGSHKVWQKIGKVVAGRIVNGYARGDWLLKFLFRTVNVEFNHIAGLGPIKWSNRRMHNIDLSDVVKGHKDYLKELPTILRIIGINTRDDKVKDQGPTHIPPHKLLPNTENCDFTSSEEEDNVSLDSHSNMKNHHGNEEHNHGNEKNQHENEQQHYGNEEHHHGNKKNHHEKEEHHRGNEEHHHGKEEHFHENEHHRGNEEHQHGNEELHHGNEEFHHGNESQHATKEVHHGNEENLLHNHSNHGNKIDTTEVNSDSVSLVKEVNNGLKLESSGSGDSYKSCTSEDMKDILEEFPSSGCHGNIDCHQDNVDKNTGDKFDSMVEENLRDVSETCTKAENKNSVNMTEIVTDDDVTCSSDFVCHAVGTRDKIDCALQEGSKNRNENRKDGDSDIANACDMNTLGKG